MADGDQSFGKSILNFARGHMQHRVGDGECFALADKALRKSGAKSASDYGSITDDADYVWGEPIALEDVQSGDILQFRDYIITTKTVTVETLPDGGEKTFWKEEISERPHHTAVVDQNLNNGQLWIFEQNAKPAGKKVQRFKLPISSTEVKGEKKGAKETFITTIIQVKGIIQAYRPQKR